MVNEILKQNSVYVHGSHGHVNMYLIKDTDGFLAIHGWELPEELIVDNEYYSHSYNVVTTRMKSFEEFNKLYLELFEDYKP